jgi:hypothetical protein
LSQKASHQHEKCQHTDNPARASALSRFILRKQME